MEINTHDLNIDLKSLNRAAAATTEWPQNFGYSTEIHYNAKTGIVSWTEINDNNWTETTPDVIIVTRTAHRHTAQWIADRIAEAIEYRKN